MPLPPEEQSKADLQRLDDAKVGGQTTYVVQMELPPEAPTGRLFYVHQKHLLPIKISFMDREEKPFKRLVMKKLKKVQGKLIPVEMVMKNIQKGSKTVCE